MTLGFLLFLSNFVVINLSYINDQIVPDLTSGSPLNLKSGFTQFQWSSGFCCTELHVHVGHGGEADLDKVTHNI